MKQLVLLYQVYSHSLSLSIDVPFTNGIYTHGIPYSWCSYCDPAFCSLHRSGISSDLSFFLLIPLFIVSSNLRKQIASHLIISDESDYFDDFDEW